MKLITAIAALALVAGSMDVEAQKRGDASKTPGGGKNAGAGQERGYDRGFTVLWAVVGSKAFSLVGRHRQQRLCCGEASVALLPLIQPLLNRHHSISLSCR